MVVAGRETVGLEEGAREARDAARVADADSAAGLEVRGRLAAALEAAGASEEREVVLPGEERGAAPLPVVVRGARRTAFLFSSPEVTDERSGSASEAVLDVVARRAAAAGARTGGLFSVEEAPAVETREEVLVRGAVAGERVLVVEADTLVEAGLRAAVLAVLAVPAVAGGRRGGSRWSRGAAEAMRRTMDEFGVEGLGKGFLVDVASGVVGRPGSMYAHRTPHTAPRTMERAFRIV